MAPSRIHRLKKLNHADSVALPETLTRSARHDNDASGTAPASIRDHPPLQKTSRRPIKEVQSEEPIALTERLGQLDIHSWTNSAAPPSLEREHLADDRLNSNASDTSDEPATLRGHLAPPGLAFCPILPLSKYPYRFISKSYSERVAEKFFNAGKFWERTWDLYYVWPPGTFGIKPLILVTEDQAQALLNEINHFFRDLDIRFDSYQRELGLVINFPDHPALWPRYLGKSTSKRKFTNMENKVPQAGFSAPGEPQSGPPEDRSLAAFKKMIDDAIDLNKSRNKASRAKKKEERVVKQQNMGNQLKRCQRYLGLRNRRGPEDTAPAPAIDVSQPAPYQFDSSVVFICVDVEANERNHNEITEIGLATLDTRDLVGIPSGPDGKDWFSKIRARHIRIWESRNVRNSEFVNGCPDRFEFGKSEFVRLQEAPAAIATCFRPPYSGDIDPGVDSDSAAAASGSLTGGIKLSNNAPGHANDLNEKRNIILVGHDASMDINYLQKLGYNPLNLSNLMEVLDTALMYRAWKRDPNPRSLGRILYDFDITAWNLHNAGNDAVYTLTAMITTAVREASMRGTSEIVNLRKATLANHLKELTEEAARRAQEDAEGWSSAEGEDGGEAERVQKGGFVPSAPSGPAGSRTAYRKNESSKTRSEAAKGKRPVYSRFDE